MSLPGRRRAHYDDGEAVAVLGFCRAGPVRCFGQRAGGRYSGGKGSRRGCAGCHGADGVSQTALIPSLAAQPDYYTQWQLIYFRGGARKSDVMGPISQALPTTTSKISALIMLRCRRPSRKPPPMNLRSGARSLRRRVAARHAMPTIFLEMSSRRVLPTSARTCCSKRCRIINLEAVWARGRHYGGSRLSAQ